MLKKISSTTELLNKQILRCESIIALEPKLRDDVNLTFNVVNESYNSQVFRCFWGHIQKSIEAAPIFSYDKIADFLGCSEQDAKAVFGHYANQLYLTNRLDYLKAHLITLKRKLH